MMPLNEINFKDAKATLHWKKEGLKLKVGNEYE